MSHIVIDCKLADSCKNFSSFTKIYNKLEELANTRQDNMLYKLIFKKMFRNLHVNTIRNIFNEDINIWLFDYFEHNISDDDCFDTDDETIEVLFYLGKGTYYAHVSDVIKHSIQFLTDNRFSRLKKYIDELVDTLTQLGFINIRVSNYEKSDLSFLTHDRKNIERKIEEFINIIRKTSTPTIDLKYELSFNITPTNIDFNKDTNFEYFIKNYFYFYDTFHKLVYDKYDMCCHNFENLQNFLNFSYKDLQNIFNNSANINELITFNDDIHDLCTTQIMMYLHTKDKDKDNSDTDLNFNIERFDVKFIRVERLKTFIDFYTEFLSLMRQFNEKYNEYNIINVDLNFYLNNSIVKLSNSAEENYDTILTKVKEQIEQSLAHFI